MRNKRGFELFNTRPALENLDIDFMEKTYGIILPSLYRVFIQTFYCTGVEPIYTEKFSNPADSSLLLAATSAYRGIEGTESFSGFYDLETVLNAKDQIEEWSEKKYLPIADAFHGHGAILVGTRPQDQDQIILHNDEFGQFTKIADNIFEFSRSIELEVEFYKYHVNHSDLYRNWNEDFWRLKSES